MSGYSRQSVADIIANEIIKAAPINAELNAIRDAFLFTIGHKHDGTSTEGAYVPLIADVDGNNKLVVDTSNNRVGVFVEVSSNPVEQVRFQDGAVVPVTDNDIDLGTTTLEFKNLYLDGTATIDTLSVDENATITGNLTVNGNTTLGNAATDTVTITADVASDLIPSTDGTYDLGAVGSEWQDLFIDGTANIDSLVADTADIDGGTIDGATIGGNSAAAGTFTNLTSTGTSTHATVDINGGNIDGTAIGGSTPAAGAFTTLAASSTTTLSGALNVSGLLTASGNLSSTGTSTLSTVDINGGNIDGTAIGASSASTGAFTSLTASGTSTLTTVDINGGNIDGTTIGASTPAAGSFTTVSTSGQATLDSVNIDGGTIDDTTIGGSTPAAITGTTITANTQFTGDLVGNVTGNVSGNLTGNVSGNVTGNLTGNVTASTGTSTFNDVTINGTLDVTGTTIANVTDPVNAQDAATKNYVDSEISALIDSAPGTLDTLNELAAALGDDANFSTTVTNSIATKLPLAGGTMTGNIAMGTNSITGMADPVANQDAATKVYVDNADALKLSLSGGTMTGNITMGSNKVTSTATPTTDDDLTRKGYVDSILGSATSAAASASAAAISASNAATSETNAGNSASAAAASYDSFDDRYLGAKSSPPATDNDGDPLITGALYFDTTANLMKVYDGASWVDAGSAVNGTAERNVYTATGGQTTFSVTYDVGFVDVYLNGVKLVAGTDFTATNGTSVVLTTGATNGDIVDIVAYGAFNIANTYTQAAADAKFLQVTNNLSDLNDAPTALTNLGLTATASELNVLDGITADVNELNLLDGVTATTTELNYVDGVTSAIQTQLDAKASTGKAIAMAIVFGG